VGITIEASTKTIDSDTRKGTPNLFKLRPPGKETGSWVADTHTCLRRKKLESRDAGAAIRKN